MFKYYDVRGVWGKDIDPWKAEKLGGAVRTLLGDAEVAVGRDVRFSSDVLAFHLSEGLGGEVIEIGIATTPMAYFFAWQEGVNTLQVTASHNPPEYNGVKFVDEKGFDWPVDRIRELERAYRDSYPVGNPEKTFYRGWEDDYFEIFESWEVPRVSLGFDPSNGTGYLLTPLLEALFELYPVNYVPDGRFPNHPPDPLRPEAKEALKELRGEWGLMLDGDGDRGTIKFGGRVLGSDEVVAALAERGVLGKKVAVEVTMPLKLEQFLEDSGIKVVRTPTGRVLIKEIARREDIDFFAEYSGHYGFREFNYIDDPLYLFFTLLEATEGRFSTSYTPPAFKETFSIRATAKGVEELVNVLDPDEVVTLDGYDMRKDGLRVVVRKSRTEDGVWRVHIEAEDRETLNKVKGVISAWLSSRG